MEYQSDQEQKAQMHYGAKCTSEMLCSNIMFKM